MHNKLFVTVLTLVAVANVSARSLRRFESFDLFASPQAEVNPTCHTKTVMTYDYLNHTVELKEIVGGLCEIYVLPNTRVYSVDAGRANAQGSVVHGERLLANGNKDLLTIRDVRNAVVGDYDFAIAVTEELATGDSITRYTLAPNKFLGGDLACFGHAGDRIVEIESVVLNGIPAVEVQFSQSAGPMLPAFSPVGPAQPYKIDSVVSKDGVTTILGTSTGMSFAGGGSAKLHLSIAPGGKSSLVLSHTNHVEFHMQPFAMNLSCEIR